jgi:hypothetical protein
MDKSLGVQRMEDSKPISHGDLRGLFEHLDRTSMTGYECDHTFALTEAFLQEKGLSVDTVLQWLGENGGGCDCEVIFNVAQQWEEVVGYVPSDADNGPPPAHEMRNQKWKHWRYANPPPPGHWHPAHREIKFPISSSPRAARPGLSGAGRRIMVIRRGCILQVRSVTLVARGGRR